MTKCEKCGDGIQNYYEDEGQRFKGETPRLEYRGIAGFDKKIEKQRRKRVHYKIGFIICMVR